METSDTPKRQLCPDFEAETAPPPIKKARLDAAEQVPSIDIRDLILDDVLWFPKGDIVLAAGNRAFCVNQAVLAHRSSVFSDLFTLAGDAVDAETMYDRPVVRLHDAHEDIRHLLLVLCCGKNYYFAEDEPVPIELAPLSALIRMAHKYDIPDMLADGLARLKKQYPTTFEEYVALDKREAPHVVVATPEEHIQVVRIARLTDTPSIVPLAIYRCASVLPEDLLRAASDRDLDGEELTVVGLTLEEVAAIIGARGHLMLHAGHRLSVLEARLATRSVREACSTNSCGKSDLEEAWDQISPTNALQSWEDMIGKEDSFCKECRAELVEEDKRAREWLWDALRMEEITMRFGFAT